MSTQKRTIENFPRMKDRRRGREIRKQNLLDLPDVVKLLSQVAEAYAEAIKVWVQAWMNVAKGIGEAFGTISAASKNSGGVVHGGAGGVEESGVNIHRDQSGLHLAGMERADGGGDDAPDGSDGGQRNAANTLRI